MTEDRQADLEALYSAMRKLMPALDAAGVDPDALEKVRNIQLTDREAKVMATYLDELGEIIRTFRA